MLAREATLTAIDFETTGTVKGYPNEPWQIGMVCLHQGKVYIENQFNALLKVGDRPFNLYVPGRHQELRQEMTVAPSMQDLWPQLQPWFNTHGLVAHNAGTEKKVLGTAFPMHPFGPWIDTLTLTRLAYPHLETHKLDDVIIALNLKNELEELCPGMEAHDAFYDAVASALIIQFLLTLPSWKNLPLESLINARSGSAYRKK